MKTLTVQWSHYIIMLAKNTNALSQDGLKFTTFTVRNSIRNLLWKDYGEVLKTFSSHRSAVKIRRFRRIVPAEGIVKLADMLHSLSSQK